jgi:hypothetical protein
VGSRECGDEPPGSGAMELVSYTGILRQKINFKGKNKQIRKQGRIQHTKWESKEKGTNVD